MGGEDGDNKARLSMSLEDLIKKEKKGKKPAAATKQKGGKGGASGGGAAKPGKGGRRGGSSGSRDGGGGGGDLRSRLGARQGRVEKGGSGRGRDRGGRRGGRDARDDHPRRDQSRREDEPTVPKEPAHPEKVNFDSESGELSITLGDVEICKVDWSGSMTLTTGGNMDEAHFEALNRALRPILYKVTKQSEDSWSITDGRRIMRFYDGVCMPPTGPLSSQRAYKIQQRYKYYGRGGGSGRGGYRGRGKGRGRGRGGHYRSW